MKRRISTQVDWCTWVYADQDDVWIGEEIASLLPHGSGIDGNWHITIGQRANPLVEGEYHSMNNGMYCCNIAFQFDVIRVGERWHVAPVRLRRGGCRSCRDGLADYLWDIIDYAMNAVEPGVDGGEDVH